MPWLTEYFMTAKQTDQLVGTLKHTELLAAGLFGEAEKWTPIIGQADKYPPFTKRSAGVAWDSDRRMVPTVIVAERGTAMV